MKKRALSIFLALVILVGSLPTTALAAEHEVVDGPIQEKTPQLFPKEDNVPAELSADGEWLTIPGIEGGQIKFDSSAGEIVDCEDTVTIANIPAQINGVAVTSIGDSAFQGCTGLTSVTIPDSVTKIRAWAFFGCTGLTSVTIPGSVTNIEARAFSDCTGLTSVTISEGVTSIPANAFNSCAGLTSVIIPEGVTSIGSGAFYNCTNLTSVIIPASVRQIGGGAFSGTPWLKKFGDFAVFNGILLEYQGRGGNVTIPSSVTSIGEEAFFDCTGLTSVTIPSSVTSIERSAFSDCTGLTNVTIPESVNSIGRYAFDGCNSLTNVTIPESVNSIRACAFRGCTGLKTAGPIGGNYNIQFGWTNEIPDFAFDDCSSLTNVIIPEGVTSIGSDAFSGCTGLISVTIPDSVTQIGDAAFRDCTGLTNVTIPEGITSIGSDAFDGCTGLTSVTIPSSVTSIEWGAFSGCTGLTNVTIPDSVTKIRSWAFSGCTGLTSVTIPNSVTSISDFAFYNCTGLTDVYYSGDESQWTKIEIGIKNDKLTSATIHYNSTGPTLKHTVPKDKYMFHVVDEKGKDLSGAIVTWNSTTQTTTSKGLATFDLMTVDMPTVTVSKDGYITWTNADSNWTKSPDRYEDVILYPEALGVYKLASCRYSNSSLMTQDTNLLTTTKTVSLGSAFADADSDFDMFYVSCGTNNPSNVDHYELWQGSKKIAQESVGFFRLSTNQFKDGGGCFIRVVSKDGDKVDTRINLQFKTAKINKASSVSWGGKSFSVKVPDNVPFLGGSTFNAALPIQLPITFLAADDKLQIGLNVNVAGGDTPSEQMKKARDALRYAKRAGSMNLGKLDSQQEKIFQSLVQKTNKLTVFKGGEVNALGYLEADWGSSKATGHIMIQGKISPVKFGYTTWVVVAPVTANVELSLEGGVIGEISYDWENAVFMGTLDFEPSVTLTAFGGVGVDKFIGAGAYGSAILKAVCRLEGPTTGWKNVDLTGELGLKAYIAWIEYEKPFAHNTWNIYTSNTVKSASLMDTEKHWQAALFSAEDYQSQDLSYLAEESGWLGDANNRVQLFAASGASTTLTPLLTDTYRNAQPTLVASTDGIYAAFLRADAVSGDIYTAVTKYDGSIWTNPVRVDSDAILDSAPTLCVDDSGTLWMAYARTAAGVDKTNLSDYAKKQSIVVGTLDSDTLTFTQKAEFPGTGYAHMPQLAVIDGVPTLAWVDSPVTDNNSVLWPTSATICTSTGDGNIWGAATTVETVEKPVTQLILGEKDGKKAVAYVADEDGDATTQEDWNLYADGVLVAQQVQGTVTLNQAPGMSSANYMWNGDGYLETANGIHIPAVGISNEYAVTDSRIYYSSASATEQSGAHLTTVLYDNGVWSEAVTLTGGERYLEDLSVVTWKGQDYLLGMDTLAEITEDNVIDAKNLVWTMVMPSSDLRLDGLSYPTEGLVVGEDVTVTITVTNAGDHNIDSIDVTLGNNHWTETCELAPGQSLDITYTMTCPAALTDYTVSVVETGWEDFTPEDNTATLSLGHAQLNVKLKEQRIGTAQALVAIVINTGIDSDSGTLRFTNEAGEVLDEVELSTLTAGDSEIVTYPAQLSNGDYTVTLLCGEKSLYTDDMDTIHIMETDKTVLNGTVTLTNVNGIITATVTDAQADSYDIVWLRDGVTISGQSGAIYALTSADKGHTISVKLLGKGDYTGEVVAEGVIVPAEAPDAPVVQAIGGNRQAVLTWAAPSDNGDPITGYIVEMIAPELKSASTSATATSYTFTDLVNGTEYTFTVKAVNSIGTGAVSTVVKVTPKGGNGGGGGGGGNVSTPANPTQTVINPDGSKTTTVTNSDGTVKEITVTTDGTKTEVTTKPNGSVTTTVTCTNGVKTQATTTVTGETTAKVTMPTHLDKVKVTIPVKNITFGTVAVLVKSDGTEEILKTSVPTDTGLMVTLTESAELKLVDYSKYFEDTIGHWAECYVAFTTARDLFQGTSETTFSPNAVMTRSMFATVLYRLDGECRSNIVVSFADVEKDIWYTDAVSWATEKNIVTGYANGNFGPNDSITREQLAVMLWRYAGNPLSSGTLNEFTDSDKAGSWATCALCWAVEQGIITGNGDGILDPTGQATRAEVATILTRYLQK